MAKNCQTYHYCVDHKAWCIHTPAECHLKIKRNAGAAPPPIPPNANAADRIVISCASREILQSPSEDEG
jgi:hypothetical protein